MVEMDARRLRVLHTVAVRGGVTAAAETLCVSPSAVSQQLAQLEREAGCDLVERAGRGITLTDAGRALAIRAEEVLHALDRAQATVEAARRGVTGTVRIGSFPSVAGAIIAPAAARLQPGVDIRISESEDDASLADLRLTRLDVVIMQEYDHVPVSLPPGLVAHKIYEDPMHVVAPPSVHEGLPLAALRDERWIAAPPGLPCGKATRQACRDAGFEPDVRHTISDFTLTLDLVAAGLGLAIVPELGLRNMPRGVISWPAFDPVLKRTIYAVVRAPGVGRLRPAVAALLQALAE